MTVYDDDPTEQELLAEIQEQIFGKKRECIAIEDFLKAADTMLDLWARHREASGLTALFCVAWAMEPDYFDFPLARLGQLDGERSIAWTRLTNGVCLGNGPYVSALIAHIGEARSAELLATARCRLAALQDAQA